MNNNLISKYYLRMQNEITNYSHILESLVKIKPEVINDSVVNSNSYLEFIKLFYQYYESNSELANKLIIKYYLIEDENPLIDNRILAAIVKYYENINSTYFLKSNKKIIITWALILSLAYEIVDLMNPFAKTSTDIREYIQGRLTAISQLSYLDIDLNNSNKIREIEIRVIEYSKSLKKYFKSFNSDKSYNIFLNIDFDKLYYLVEYTYVIDELSKYNKKDLVKYTDSKVNEALFFISCNLLSMTILKEILCNNQKKYYVLKIDSKIYQKQGNIENLNIVFDNPKIKEYMYLMIDDINYLKDTININRLRNMGYKIMIDCTKTADIGNIVREMNGKDTLLVSKEIYESNNNYLKFISEKKIKIIVNNRSNKIMKNNF